MAASFCNLRIFIYLFEYFLKLCRVFMLEEQVCDIPIYQRFRAQDAQAEKSSPTAAPSGILPSGIFPAMPVVRQVFMSLLPQLTLLRPGKQLFEDFARILFFYREAEERTCPSSSCPKSSRMMVLLRVWKTLRKEDL
jgi:hypothetical protein